MNDLWQWWNLVYLVPLIIAMLYLGISVTFGLVEGGHDADHDVDHDVDVDAHHDVDLDADSDADADADADADQDGDHEGEAQGSGLDPAALLLLAIGARQVTTGLAIQFLLLSWGIIGLMVNQTLSQWLGAPRVYIGPSVLITLVGSVGTTRVLTTLMGKVVPKDDSAALRRVDLEGHTAQCLYSIDHDSGVAIAKDKYGHRHQVACRTQGDEIARGAEVVLVEYVPERDYFLVEQVPDEWRPLQARQSSDPAQDSPSVKTGS